VGSGATLKRLKLTRIRDIEIITDCLTGSVDEDARTLRDRLAASEWTGMLLLDEQKRPLRWLRAPDLDQGRSLREAGLPAKAFVEPHATLSDALEEMLLGSAGVSIVVDKHGVYQGIVDVDTIIITIQEMRDASAEFYRTAKLVDPAEVAG
jgi:osmoprotectant transport system ATP-binding protein